MSHDFRSIFVQRIRRLVILELSSIFPFREYLCLERLSLSESTLVVELALMEILHNRDGCPPISIAEHKFAAEVH